MLVRVRLVEQRHRAVLEVLDGGLKSSHFSSLEIFGSTQVEPLEKLILIRSAMSKKTTVAPKKSRDQSRLNGRHEGACHRENYGDCHRPQGTRHQPAARA